MNVNELIAEARLMLDAATPWPWEVSDERGVQFTDGEGGLGIAQVGGCLIAADFDAWDEGCAIADAELIVWARNNLPALLDTLARVREIAEKAASANWRHTARLSIDAAEGMNEVGEEILRAMDGDES